MRLFRSVVTGVVMLSISLLSDKLVTSDLAHRPVSMRMPTAAAGSVAAHNLNDPLWRRYVITGPAQILLHSSVRDRT
ncbi:MAG: hypothetical protein ACRYHQ_24980 [Janthinobacterium lividum]